MGYFRMYPYKMRIESKEANLKWANLKEDFRMYPYKMRIERLCCMLQKVFQDSFQNVSL